MCEVLTARRLCWKSGTGVKRIRANEMVFRDKVAGGDYHENMDGVMFMKWINTRLVPTMRKLHPDKKVYLVMDNTISSWEE